MPGKKRLLPFEKEVIKKREEKFIPAWMRGSKVAPAVKRKPSFSESLAPAKNKPVIPQGPTQVAKPKVAKKPSKFRAGLSRALEAAAYGITAQVGPVAPGQEARAGLLKGIVGTGLASAARRKRAFEAGKPAREIETFKEKLKLALPGKLKVARASGEVATQRAITISKLEKPLSSREKLTAYTAAGKIAEGVDSPGTSKYNDARQEEYMRILRTIKPGGLSFKGFK